MIVTPMVPLRKRLRTSRPRAAMRAVAAVALALSMMAASPASASPLFSDGFESGTMANWNKSVGITVQQADVHTGAWAARATSAGSASWAWKSLSTAQSNLYLDTWFKVLSHSSTHYLLRFRTAANGLVASLGDNTSDKLYLRNDTAAKTTTSTTVVSKGVWHEAQVHVRVNGTSSQTEVWLDGAPVAQLGMTTSLGTAPIGRIQIGDNSTTRTSDVLFDDVTADTSFIGGGGDTQAPSTPTGLAANAPAAHRVDLTWNAAPESDVAGYTVYRGGSSIATVTGAATTSYSDTTVSASTTYSYSVDAFDTSSNHSAPSSPPVQVTTPAGNNNDPVIAAAGDIACSPASGAFNGGNGTAKQCRQRYTADILQNLRSTTNLQAILPLGDLQYECGGLSEFNQSYALSWGVAALKAISHPAVGNHEYLATGGTGCSATADGYYSYFGAAAGDPSKGYYSYDVGSWHLIALNSECAIVSCSTGSAQEQWLQNDLATHQAACTIAYWHRPRFASNSGSGGEDKVAPFWTDLYNAGAEIVLGGHFHVYERSGPQTPSQVSDPANGIRQFIVGTGGNSLAAFGTPQPNSEVRDNATYGVLKLTLHASSYDWQFIPEAGKTFTDTGTGTCH